MAPSQLPTAAAASPAPAVRQASSVQFTHSELQWPRHICPLPPPPARPPLSDSRDRSVISLFIYLPVASFSVICNLWKKSGWRSLYRNVE